MENITEEFYNVTINRTTTSWNEWAEVVNSSATTSAVAQMYVFPVLPGWVSTLYLVLLLTTIVLGIPGNLITAIAYFSANPKSSCDWYIFFVALSDLISCVFRVTGYLMEFLGVWVKLTNTAYCVFVAWISQTSVCVSIFIFGLISIERCIKICCVTSMNIHPKRSRNICLIITALTFVMGCPTVFIFTNTPIGLCTVASDAYEKAWVKIYYCIILSFFIALTVAASVCYIAIIWTVRKRRKTVGVFPERNTAYSIQTSNQSIGKHTIPTQKKISGQSSETRSSSEASSPPYLTMNQTATAEDSVVSRLSVPKLFIVPGPQTKVIVQQINRTTTTTVLSDTNSRHQKTEFKDNKNKKTPDSPPSVDSQIGNQSINIFSQMQYARRQRRDFKITGLLFLVTFIFIVSWIPPYYATVKAFFIGYTFPMSMSEFITLKLAPTSFIINNFSNPIIYLALSSTYRQKVRHICAKCIRFLKRLNPCK